MVLLSLTAESCDHVCGYAAVRHHFPDLVDSFQIPFAVIFSPHLLQHHAASGLNRKVDMPAYVLMAGHCVYDLVADVLGMRSGESHPELRIHCRHHLKQLCKSHILPFI